MSSRPVRKTQVPSTLRFYQENSAPAPAPRDPPSSSSVPGVVVPRLPSTMSRPFHNNKRAASVTTEEEDDARIDEEFDEVVEVDGSGNARTKSTKPAKKKNRVYASTDDDIEEIPAPATGTSTASAPSSTPAPADGDVPEAPDEDPEAQLARMLPGFTSAVYAFFQTPIWGEKDGRRWHEFKCAGRGCKYSVKRYLDTTDRTSTGRMIRHVKKVTCWGPEVYEAADKVGNAKEARKQVVEPLRSTGSIKVMFERTGKGTVSYSSHPHTRAEARAETVRWVAESCRPFSIVKDRGYQSLMKTGRPSYYIPSPSTVSRDTKRVFANTRQRVAKILREYDGKLSFEVDCWTSPNHKAMFGIKVTFERDDAPLTIILDVVEVPKSHTGEELAREFLRILEDFGIEYKILSITGDNATNNDKMITELDFLLAEFSSANQTRCFLHIINLIAKSFLKQFEMPKRSRRQPNGVGTTNNDDDSDDMPELEDVEDEDDEEEEDNFEGWVDELGEMSDEECLELLEKLKPVRLTLSKIRRLSFKVINSSTKLLPAWKSLLVSLEKSPRIIPRDVKTRWNSTYDMLLFVWGHRDAYDTFTSSRENNLRDYELEEGEWKIVKHMMDILGALKDATLFFSRDGLTNLPMVIPVMDDIDRFFTDAERDAKKPRCIRASVTVAKRTLNRYYSYTDSADVYRIAMVLHPRYRLQYFRDMNWPEEWIQEAERLVRQRFDEDYASLPIDDEDVVGPGNDGSSVSDEERENDKPAGNRYDKLDVLRPPKKMTIQNELELYLRGEPKHTMSPIKWWKKNAGLYPRLSRMAIDYLTIPATSVDVERLFSRGRQLLQYTRNRLSAQSIRALLCLGEWSRLGLVKDKDILEVTTAEAEVNGEHDVLMEDGWDSIRKA